MPNNSLRARKLADFHHELGNVYEDTCRILDGIDEEDSVTSHRICLDLLRRSVLDAANLTTCIDVVERGGDANMPESLRANLAGYDPDLKCSQLSLRENRILVHAAKLSKNYHELGISHAAIGRLYDLLATNEDHLSKARLLTAEEQRKISELLDQIDELENGPRDERPSLYVMPKGHPAKPELRSPAS